MFRIGMLTSGGDCQALNAAMRGVVKGLCSKRNDVEIYGFQDGYKGLIYSNFEMLTAKDFSGILTMGGTILGTSRQPFKLMRVPGPDGIDKVEANVPKNWFVSHRNVSNLDLRRQNHGTISETLQMRSIHMQKQMAILL
jgi:hypothetical protein